MRRALRWVLIMVGLAGLAVLLSPIVLPTRPPETPQFGGRAARARVHRDHARGDRRLHEEGQPDRDLEARPQVVAPLLRGR